jgi:hypothetical protein
MISIAVEHGFPSGEFLLKHGDNEPLAAERKVPGVLMEGDEVAIPDHAKYQKPIATDKVHKIVVKVPKVALRLRLVDVDDKPLAGVNYRLVSSEGEEEGATDGDGVVDHVWKSLPSKCELLVPHEDGTLDDGPRYGWKLQLGHLDPIETPAGVRQRLMNLGYWPDSNEDPAKILPYALRGFQYQNDLEISGKLDDATKAELLKEHDNV